MALVLAGRINHYLFLSFFSKRMRRTRPPTRRADAITLRLYSDLRAVSCIVHATPPVTRLASPPPKSYTTRRFAERFAVV